jgi:hypothetical protein
MGAFGPQQAPLAGNYSTVIFGTDCYVAERVLTC